MAVVFFVVVIGLSQIKIAPLRKSFFFALNEMNTLIQSFFYQKVILLNENFFVNFLSTQRIKKYLEFYLVTLKKI